MYHYFLQCLNCVCRVYILNQNVKLSTANIFIQSSPYAEIKIFLWPKHFYLDTPSETDVWRDQKYFFLSGWKIATITQITPVNNNKSVCYDYYYSILCHYLAVLQMFLVLAKLKEDTATIPRVIIKGHFIFSFPFNWMQYWKLYWSTIFVNSYYWNKNKMKKYE